MSDQALRRGWTTGACATAATKAALFLLAGREAPDPVEIALPKGDKPAFPLAFEEVLPGGARVGIVKDAGDDPDVTHGAIIISTVRRGAHGSGITFRAGVGVGTVTKSGLPISVGEAAINPVPRRLMTEVAIEIGAQLGLGPDIEISISIPGGEELAAKTWNPRLGIVGGLSILGTTGVVHPFSCSAWIHSIHRGIDVARADNLSRVVGSTGSTSETAAQRLYGLPDHAMIDMGDFAGGMLKYLRNHPIPNVSIAGGFAKLSKLAQGHLDLHSGRSQVDMHFLSAIMEDLGADAALLERIPNANTAAEVLELARANDLPLARVIARHAQTAALETLRGAPVDVEIIIVDRDGTILARVGA